MDRSGRIKTLRRRELKFGYRSSNLARYIILEATLGLEKAERNGLNSRCAKFLKMKSEKQALDVPSAGCVFKNPPDSQFTSGQMIDMLGLKGSRIGGAEISTKHANFIINRKGARCADVLRLIELIRSRVTKNYGIPLKLEIKIV
jgi:UDP-N-acetylmuramate dehydrogenase